VFFSTNQNCDSIHFLAMGKDRKQVSADPNNKHWAEDKSQFGFKMMAKMGWTEGSGLGVKQNGIAQNIKVSKKIDNGGLGNKGNSSDVCTKMVVFESILAKLQPINEKKRSKSDDSEDSEADSKKKKVEKNTEKKERRRYRRTREKIAKKSQEDLDAIFAK
jgi:Pin2-interacting protein X1